MRVSLRLSIILSVGVMVSAAGLFFTARSAVAVYEINDSLQFFPRLGNENVRDVSPRIRSGGSPGFPELRDERQIEVSRNSIRTPLTQTQAKWLESLDSQPWQIIASYEGPETDFPDSQPLLPDWNGKLIPLSEWKIVINRPPVSPAPSRPLTDSGRK